MSTSAGTELVSRRLIISGITPSISASDLTARFSSFGTVKDLSGIGKVDALGQPTKYAYLTLETTQSKLSRCMSGLNGASWKGAKLRVGDARPDYTERIASENSPPPSIPSKRPLENDSTAAASSSTTEPPNKKAKALEKKLKKREKRASKGMGREASDMSPVTAENVKSKKGWKLVPPPSDSVAIVNESFSPPAGVQALPTTTLIRPIRMRPSHPLPPATHPPLPTDPPSATSIRKAEKAVEDAAKAKKAAKEEKKSQFKKNKKDKKDIKSTATSASVKKSEKSRVTRAFPTIIDPVRYGVKHIKLEGEPVRKDRPGEGETGWEWDDERNAWVKSAMNDEGELEVIVVDKVAKATSSQHPKASSSSLSSTPPVEQMESSGSSNHLPPTSPASTSRSPSAQPSFKVTVPSPPVPTATTTTTLANPNIATQIPPPSTKPAPPPVEDAVAIELANERSSQLAFMRSLLSKGWEVDLDDLEGNDEAQAPQAGKVVRVASPEAEAPETQSTEVEDEQEEIVSESESSDDEDGPRVAMAGFTHDPSRLNDESMDVDEPEPMASTSEEVSKEGASASGSKSLKEMFAPREEDVGFSLFGNLTASGIELDDFELEEEEHGAPIVSDSTAVMATAFEMVPSGPITLRADPTATITLDPSTLMFFPIHPLMRDGFAVPGVRARRPPDVFDLAAEKGWNKFFEKRSEEEIRSSWDTVKGDLTREFKKRHREAVKKRRRGHGGGGGGGEKDVD